jgi:hypothetical protein
VFGLVLAIGYCPLETQFAGITIFLCKIKRVRHQKPRPRLLNRPPMQPYSDREVIHYLCLEEDEDTADLLLPASVR